MCAGVVIAQPQDEMRIASTGSLPVASCDAQGLVYDEAR